MDESESNNNQSETANNPVSANEPAKVKNESSVLKNAVTGVVGVAAGAAGVMVAAGFKEPEQQISNHGQHDQPILEPSQFNGEEVPVAQNVNDGMNFDEAFAAARKEVGPGGVFAWHGNVYGTYYANEWQDISAEYRHSFSSYAYDVKPVEVQELAELTGESFTHEAEPVLAGNIMSENEDRVVIINAQNVIVVNSADIEDGEQDITLVTADIDGHDVAVVDTGFDDDYSITVIDDDNCSDPWSTGYAEDGGVNLAEDCQPLPDTPVAEQDSVNDCTHLSDYMTDFNNNEDVSNF